jgi:hypothetical protein
MQPDDRAVPTTTRAYPPLGGRGAVLWMLAASAAVVGVWALLAPASFYADFVLGRGWIALDGPYNEHLVRDVGALNLALAVVTAAAAHRRDPWLIRLAAVATLVYAVPHLAYHTTAMGPFGVGDAVAQLVALTFQIAAPILLMWRPVPVAALDGTTHRTRSDDAVAPRR